MHMPTQENDKLFREIPMMCFLIFFIIKGISELKQNKKGTLCQRQCLVLIVLLLLSFDF